MWKWWQAVIAWKTLLAGKCRNISWLQTCKEALKCFAGEQSHFSSHLSFFRAPFIILSLVNQKCLTKRILQQQGRNRALKDRTSSMYLGCV